MTKPATAGPFAAASRSAHNSRVHAARVLTSLITAYLGAGRSGCALPFIPANMLGSACHSVDDSVWLPTHTLDFIEMLRLDE